MEQNQKLLIVENTPIPFVLLGPKDEVSCVLVKSINAQIDLMSLAADGLSDSTTRSLSQSKALFKLPRQICSVWSYPINRDKEVKNKRTVQYILCWEGSASRRDIKFVKDKLNKHIIDINLALNSGNLEQVELNLSSVILACAKAQMRSNFRIWRSIIFTVMYLMVLVLIFIYLLK